MMLYIYWAVLLNPSTYAKRPDIREIEAFLKESD